jgi:hypothetical protein
MQVRKETGIDWLEKKLIRNLYLDQGFKLRLDQGEKKSAKIGTRVGKGRCFDTYMS